MNFELEYRDDDEPFPADRADPGLAGHNDQVHHIPLHRQFIPWAARSNVNVVHRADNWLELRWVTVNP